MCIRDRLRNDRVRLRIVGIYTYKASAFTISTASDKDLSTALYIPVTTAKRLTGAADGYSYFTVMAAGADSTAVGTQISNFLNRYYRNNDDYRVTSMSMESVIESVDLSLIHILYRGGQAAGGAQRQIRLQGLLGLRPANGA